LSFDPNVIPYALGAALRGRANFFMDDTKSKYPKPGPKALIYLSIDKYLLTK
jgi:hypothetical protein